MSDNLKIKRFIREGDLAGGDEPDTDTLLASCFPKSAEGYEPALFEGEDGKFYVASLEVVVEEANPEYVKDMLAQEEEDSDE